MGVSPTVGGELLRLLTAGMYDNPLVVYREYVQNAADAIADQGDSGSIHIRIDPVASRITIRDNGTGLSPAHAAHRLVNVGRSTKDRSTDRGFRGIGRLAGLAFAERVHFTTRTDAAHTPVRVTWDAQALRVLDLSQIDASEAIRQCTTMTRVADGDWPHRFFEVTIDRVNRHAAADLLNERTVRHYLGQVAPVCFQTGFPLAEEIRDFLAPYFDEFSIDLRVNDDAQPLNRPFGETIPLTEHFAAAFTTLETRVIPRPDDDDPAAAFWLAHTPYAGSIPRRLGIRGLRARKGNLQIGDDRIFEHLFLEPRFNGWCVGELHILDSRIVPNGRRDYFEPGPHLRNLENHIGAIAQLISARCRSASSQRNRLRNMDAAIRRTKCAADLARSGYLRTSDAESLVSRELARLPAFRQILALVQAADPHAFSCDLALYERQLNELPASPNPCLDAVPRRFLEPLQTVFATIAETMPPDSALTMIETILRRLVNADPPS